MKFNLNFLKTVTEYCFSFILPKECLGCGSEFTWLCQPCAQSLPVSSELGTCSYCVKRSSKINSLGSLCAPCCLELGVNSLLWYASYKKKLTQKVVKAIKYQGLKGIIIILVEEWWRQILDTPFTSRPQFLFDRPLEQIYLVPIPLHQRKVRVRGYNQAELIARSLAIKTGWQVAGGLLVRRKYTKTQTNLSKEERRQNLSGAFTVKKDVLAKEIYVLVDDVVTTGATLAAASRALRRAGAKRIVAFCLARG